MSKPPIKQPKKIGKKFGLLTVLSINQDRTDKLFYNCKCDCGNDRVVFTSHLSNKNPLIKHCGDNKHLPTSTKWQGVGELSGDHFGRIKRHAKDKDREFDLTIEFLWSLYIKQNKKCALSGLEIIFSRKTKDKLTTASLDRIDSTKGYTQDNVQWVHKDINKIKQNLNQERFIELCELVTITQINEKKAA